MNRPVLLLAHGSWHPPHLYDSLKEALASRDYTLVVPALPSMGANATGIGWEADTKTLLDYAEPLFKQGKEVLLVAHSYGGLPACVATRENSIAERARRGLSGGFRHVIFLCAFAIPAAGMSILDTLPNRQWFDWHTISETNGFHQISVNEKSKKHLYNDLSPKTTEEFYKALVPQSYKAVITPIDFAAPDISIPKTYIVCEKDNAFPVPLQHELSTGLGFNKLVISGGHSAFASVPDEVADALVKIAEGG
ncbi:hypothetical protein J7T55_004588 [Diaporthe amygdali]|uniref:uncharacterized protein n=1 Tax=Phomopsis amygdali TaxID=1214568 RepID=UPI0022FDC62A|nr:uncharacterized protein J7T55_004588 [Diaporthe amygdali]KAJ0114846.1 hypothetical protein J7T55_004588 [Diaporthe amygdali]